MSLLLALAAFLRLEVTAAPFTPAAAEMTAVAAVDDGGTDVDRHRAERCHHAGHCNASFLAELGPAAAVGPSGPGPAPTMPLLESRISQPPDHPPRRG